MSKSCFVTIQINTALKPKIPRTVRYPSFVTIQINTALKPPFRFILLVVRFVTIQINTALKLKGIIFEAD